MTSEERSVSNLSTATTGSAPNESPKRRQIPLWISAIFPLATLVLMLSVFALGDPLALFKSDLPPVEVLSFERVRVIPGGFEVTLINGGPDPVTVAQVLVDEAYWQFGILPSPTIPRYGRAVLHIDYPWVESEPHEIVVISSTGVTFAGEVELATLTPTPGVQQFAAYGLLGVYVGIVPVGLGMLWFPAMRRLGRRWLGGILALTLGLLFFLLIDTLLEAFEIAGTLPEVFQGISLAIFAALFTWFILLAVRSRGEQARDQNALQRGFRLAALIALGIGLHNLGEGLAIGAAFAAGEAALGSFLVIGFTVHNITEGIGIAAPMLPKLGSTDASKAEGTEATGPGLILFAGLALLAGGPAILGAWLGGFAFSPLLTVLFLGIGTGAIWQVMAEVGDLLRDYARSKDEGVITWINVGGFLLGVVIMYLTAFLVSF